MQMTMVINFADLAIEAMYGARTEIMLFVIAICTHWLLFTEHATPSAAKKQQTVGADGQQGQQQQQASGADAGHITVLEALKVAVRESNLENALHHLRGICGTVVTLPQQLVQGLVRLAIDDHALLNLLQALEACGQVSGPTSETVLKECAVRGDASTLRTIESFGLSQKLIAGTSNSAQQIAIMKGIGGKQRLAYASSFFRACSNRTPSQFNAFLDLCINCRDLVAAERVLREAVDANAATTVTFNMMVKAYAQSRDLKRAQHTIDEMRMARVLPDCVTLNAVLDSLVTKDLDEAWRFLDEMRCQDVEPNSVTCSILLKGIHTDSKLSDTKWILATVESLQDGMDEVLLSSMIEACIRVNCNDVLQRLVQRQRSPKRVAVQSPHGYGSMVRAYGYVGDIAGVWETWREMRQRHVALTSISIGCMVEALCTNGDPEGGYELIRETMADSELRLLVNAVIYGSVLKGFSHLKRLDRLWTVYREMLAEGMTFSAVTYNTLVDACARNDQMVRIPDLLNEMKQQGIEPNVITYSAIIKGYCQYRRLDKAFELLDDMKRLNNVFPDEHTYNTLLNGCAVQGLYERGIRLLEEMQEARVVPSNFTLSVLVKLCGRARRPTEAFELCQQLSKKYGLRLNVHVYNNLLQVCVAQKLQIRRAMELFERMIGENVRPDTRTYTILLRAAVECKDAEIAAGLLRAATGGRGANAGLLRAARGVATRLQPKDRLPAELVAEVLRGIAHACFDEALAKQLAQEIKR